MLNIQSGIDSLTSFKRQTAECQCGCKRQAKPLVLTINSRPKSSSKTRQPINDW